MALQIGAHAPDFYLTNVDGNIISLVDFADKAAVAVIFSCNHCPYVQAWEDRMIRIQRDYEPKGVQLLLINANDSVKYPGDSFTSMQQRAEEKHYPFPYLLDESQETARAYGAERTPEVFLLNQNRLLAYHGTIDDNVDNPKAVKENYFRDALDAVLSGQAPQPASTPAVGCTIKWK